MGKVPVIGSRIVYSQVRNTFYLALAANSGLLILFVAVAVKLGNLSLGALACVAICLPIYLFSFLFFKKGVHGLRLFCPSCGAFISTAEPWKCACCDKANESTCFHPFLGNCEHCEAEPKSYRCQRCEHLIPFEEKADTRYPASSTVKHSAPIVDETANRRKRHSEAKEAIAEEIEIAQLNRQLIALKASAEFKKEVSQLERLQKRFDEFEINLLGVDRLIEKKLPEYEQTYKNNPTKLAHLRKALEHFREEHMH